MPWKDEFEVGRIVNSIEDGQNSATGVAKDMFHAMAQHHFVENLATGETNECVVQRRVGCRSWTVDVRWGQSCVARCRNLLKAGCR